MNSVWGTAAGALLVLGFATFLLVWLPAQQTAMIDREPGLRAYTKQEGRGREVYVSLGCMYCHTQQPRDKTVGPDQERGWGRPSTPGDYYYDYPHQLGTMRTGQDLFNIGARQANQDWHLLHLYQPRAVTEGSIMPAFPFLFEVKPQAAPGDVTVDVPAPWGPSEGVVVAKQDALDLVAYLKALDHTYESAYIEVADAAGGGS